MTDSKITIHTDGCCIGNPGKGGFAAVIRRYEDGVEIEKRAVSNNSPQTTNNRMELKAAIAGLRQITRNEAAEIIVFSDSQYVVLGMTARLTKWQAKGWRIANGQPVKNQELWEALLAAADGLDVRWEWVRAHSGDPRNEEADALANKAASKPAR